MTLDKKAIKAMKTIKDYCDNVECDNCVFYLLNKNSTCLFEERLPLNWELEGE